uniref:HTH-type transcriptional regulator PksA n=2 Tax=Virgibacillus oceani TaxID=1479511 RepID=A0A917HKB0_9BACI|nr:HTH-type transcriptional regulator PksA [Virgibacillus oceani]
MEGLEQASVRKIAKEAGLSVGAMRHYFSTQSDLFAYSMKLVSDRVKKRAYEKKYDGTPLEAMQEVLSEFLPINEEQRIEMEVWLVFSAKTLVNPDLKSLGKTVYHEMRGVVEHVIQSLIDLQLAKDDLDKQLEVERLYALIDGLALHSILYPDELSSNKTVDTLKYHLQSLCT